MPTSREERNALCQEAKAKFIRLATGPNASKQDRMGAALAWPLFTESLLRTAANISALYTSNHFDDDDLQGIADYALSDENPGYRIITIALNMVLEIPEPKRQDSSPLD